MSDPYRILLVDDDEDTCEMMSLLLTLENNNYEVTSANTADEALAEMEKKSFDLYILDSLMPHLSGIELCAQIRRGDEWTPILFYSGRSESDYISQAKMAGATEYLVKPNDLERFTEIAREYLDRSGKA